MTFFGYVHHVVFVTFNNLSCSASYRQNH